MQFFNISNYKDKTYRNILLFCLFSFTAIGDIFLPLLNYLLLELPKTDSKFINYTTLINTVPTLPFMCSIILGFIANQFNYSKLVYTAIALTLAVSVILLITHKIFVGLIICSLLMSLIFRTIYLALDKHLAQLLLDKIHSFQSDLFIFGSILGIICYKLSAYIYITYHSIGLITTLIIFALCALYFAKNIPVTIKKKTIQFYLYPMIFKKLTTLDNLLLKFVFIILAFNLISSCYNSYIMLVLKQHNTSTTEFADMNAMAMCFGMILALIPKNTYSIQIQRILIICLYSLSIIMLLIQLDHNSVNIYYVIINAINSLCYIVNNIIIFRLIAKHEILKANAPVFLSIWATLLYINNIISQLISNLALKYLIDQIEIFGDSLVILLLLLSSYIWLSNR